MSRFSRENWLLLECRRGAWYCCDGGERAGFTQRAAGLRCGTEAQAGVGAGGWSWRVGMSAGAGGRARAGTRGKGLRASSPQALTLLRRVRIGPPDGVGSLGSGLKRISLQYSSLVDPQTAQIPGDSGNASSSLLSKLGAPNSVTRAQWPTRPLSFTHSANAGGAPSLCLALGVRQDG